MAIIARLAARILRSKIIRDQPADLLTDNRGSNYLTGKADGIMRMWANEPGSEGLLTYRSRAVPQTDLSLIRRPDGFWRMKDPGRLDCAQLGARGPDPERGRQVAVRALGELGGRSLNPESERDVDKMRKHYVRDV